MNGLALSGGRLAFWAKERRGRGRSYRDQTNKAMMMQCFSRHHCPTYEAKVPESSKKIML